MRSIILVCLLIISFYSQACTCGTLLPISEIDLSQVQAVFVGKVIEVNKKNDILEIVIKVSKGIKNSNKREILKIYSLADAGLCGINAQVGEKWCFFVDDLIGNLYFVDQCDRGGGMSNKKFKKSMYGDDKSYYKRLYRTQQRHYKTELRYLSKLLK